MAVDFLNTRYRDEKTSRRSCILRASACLLWPLSFESSRLFAWSECYQGEDTGEKIDEDLLAVEEQARKAGITPLSSIRSRHYQVIGNASSRFMEIVAKDCELLSMDFLRHFQDRGFEVALPDKRLTIVAFLDERPFHKFFPESTGSSIVGGYFKEKNWVVLFDWRNVPQRPRSGIANMTTLAHEAMHQLCFNTGLLSRQADVPLAIAEGLGVYAENRRLNGRSDLGRVNRSRLDDLAHILRRRDWISFKELITIDQAILAQKPDLIDLFYAQSWLLADYLIQNPMRLPLTREYFKAINERRDRSHRIEDSETYFGNLERLDRDLRAFLIHLQTGS